MWKQLENFPSNSGTCRRVQCSFLPSLPRLALRRGKPRSPSSVALVAAAACFLMFPKDFFSSIKY